MTTNDGYILTIFRITWGQESDYTPTKPPIIFNHGLLGEAYSYLGGRDYSGFWSPHHKPWELMLSDLGYDVWMTNNRGTQYSQQHTSLDAEEDNQFWEFSWAEMGLYDVPANIKIVK